MSARARERIVAGLCLIGVLAAKVLVARDIGSHPLLQPDAGLDTTTYVGLANRVLQGDLGLGPGLYYVSPFYIYFLAAAQLMTGSYLGVREIQCLLGTVTVALVYLTALEWHGRRAAWIAAALAAVCGVITFHEVLLMQSAIDPFLAAAALSFLALGLNRNQWKWCLAAGCIFGLETLNRPNILFPAVCLVVGLFFWLRSVRLAAALSLGIFIGLSPSIIRNSVVAHQWAVLPSHGGLNFFIGNSAGATGTYQVVPGVRADIIGQVEDTRRVAEGALRRPLTDGEVSDYFLDLGLAWIKSNPVSAGRLFLRKIVLSVHADHLALPSSYEFFTTDERRPLRWLFIGPGFFVPLGLVGLAIGARRNRRAYFVWAAFVPAYMVSLAVFFVAERYRLPMFPPLLVAAGGLLDRGVDMLRSRPGPFANIKTPAVGMVWGSAIVVAGVVNAPIGLGDSRQGDRLRMVLYEAKVGRFQEADRWATLAANSSSKPGLVHMLAGNSFLNAGDRPRAAIHLRLALEQGEDTPIVRVDLADSLKLEQPNQSLALLRGVSFTTDSDPDLELRAGRLAAELGDRQLAVAIFRDASTRHPTRADAWAQLGLTLLTLNTFAAAAPALERAVLLNGTDATALGGLAYAELELGNYENAKRHAAAALTIDPNERLAQQVQAVLRR